MYSSTVTGIARRRTVVTMQRAGVGDADVEALDRGRPPARRGDRRSSGSGGASAARRLAVRVAEVLAEQAGGVGVVVDAEHQLAGRRVEARAAADHLVEGDRRAHVLEEDDVADAGHVHAGGQQVHGGGDEVAARGAAQVGQVVAAAAGGRALEGVGVGAACLPFAAHQRGVAGCSWRSRRASAWRSRAQKMIVFCSGPPVASRCAKRSSHIACTRSGSRMRSSKLVGLVVLAGLARRSSELAGDGVAIGSCRRGRPVEAGLALDAGLPSRKTSRRTISQAAR